jgi:hypothetical protein
MNFIQVQHFIMTNLIQLALKHSLHQHPRRYVGDNICFLLVRVTTALLHGEVPLIGQTHPFFVFWFEDSDQDWQDFCVRNVLSSNIRFVHTYDIVIGPACLPHDGDHVFEMNLRLMVLRLLGLLCAELNNSTGKGIVQKLFSEIPEIEVSGASEVARK